MHEEPQVPNFGEPGRGPLLAPGMTLAIEPMINAGGPEVWVADDHWSISTNDGSLSAHFEHTVAVTENGPLVLTTAEPGGWNLSPFATMERRGVAELCRGCRNILP